MKAAVFGLRSALNIGIPPTHYCLNLNIAYCTGHILGKSDVN